MFQEQIYRTARDAVCIWIIGGSQGEEAVPFVR